MASGDQVDGKYYAAVPARSFGERLTIAARDRIYDDFVRHCRPAPTVRSSTSASPTW